MDYMGLCWILVLLVLRQHMDFPTTTRCFLEDMDYSRQQQPWVNYITWIILCMGGCYMPPYLTYSNRIVGACLWRNSLNSRLGVHFVLFLLGAMGLGAAAWVSGSLTNRLAYSGWRNILMGAHAGCLPGWVSRFLLLEFSLRLLDTCHWTDYFSDFLLTLYTCSYGVHCCYIYRLYAI